MKNLAKTLEIISNSGASAFYNGSLTSLMVKEINDNGEQNQIKPYIYSLTILVSI